MIKSQKWLLPFITFICCMVYSQLENKILAQYPASTETVIETILESAIAIPQSQNPDSMVFVMVDQMPEFPGGMEALNNYQVNRITYPEEAIHKGIEGTVYLNFIIEKDGSVSNVNVLRGIGGGCDEEAIRVLESMPAWEPGLQKGQPVRVLFNIPVRFKLPLAEDEVFTLVETMPQFPGGFEAMMEFVARNIQYPEEARRKGIQGRVFSNFVIEADGSVSNISVLRGIGGGCDEEAIRVIESMPKWTPGVQRGKPVRVAFNLPIRFALPTPKK